MPSRSPAGSGLPRLLVLTPDFPPRRGGIQILAHRVVAGLRRFEPIVVTPDGPGARAFDREQPFAIVRTPTADTNVGTNLRLNRAGVGVARHVRPAAVLVVHLACSPASALVRLGLGAPSLLYLHADELVDRPVLTRFAVRTAGAIVAVSTHTRDMAVAFGASPSRIARVHPGVDLPVDGTPAEPADRPTIVTVARLVDRYKGHDVVLRALPQVREHVPDVQWVVIGEGPLRGELEAQAASEGLDGTARFLGEVSDVERDAWLDRAHVFVMPSRLPPGAGGEGFGIVYTEAAAHGLPVVAGAVAGARDAVVHGETGLLVDPTDPAAVADALTRVLRDDDLARRMSELGRARARELAWALVAERVEDRLLDLLRGPA